VWSFLNSVQKRGKRERLSTKRIVNFRGVFEHTDHRETSSGTFPDKGWEAEPTIKEDGMNQGTVFQGSIEEVEEDFRGFFLGFVPKTSSFAPSIKGGIHGTEPVFLAVRT